MKKHIFKLVILFGILALAMPANAVLITPSTDTPLTGNETSQDDINDIINPLLGTSTFLYSQNADPAEENGLLAGSYETTFNGDLSGGTIEYVGGDIVGPVAYLLVKDGAQEPAWYFYNMTAPPIGWDGTEIIELSGFWPENGSISHVSLYGSSAPPPPPPVPEPGTMMLLGSGLVGLAAWGRKKFRK